MIVRSIWLFKKYDHWKEKKINKGLNPLLNGKSIVFEKQATQIEKYNTLNPSSPKRSTIWA